MKKEILLTLVISTAALLAPLYAQQTDSLKTHNLDAIVVTATKFPKAQGETGKVLTIIDEDQLRRSAGKDLAQVLNEQVGLVVNGANSNPGKDKAVYLQGASTAYTVILVDGIPLNDPSGFGGAFDLRMLQLDQIERVEILKGSQSTLYGSDAIAGVINIITRKDDQNKPIGLFGNASYGSYNTRKGTLGVNGGTKIIGYNASYTHYVTDGITEARDSTGSAGFDKDGLEQNAWQGNLNIKPTESLSLRPFFRYTKFDGKFDSDAFTDDPQLRYKSTMLTTGLTGQWDFKNGALNALYSFERTKRDYNYAFGPASYDGHFHHGEIFANYNVTSHVQALAGLSYQNWQMDDGVVSGDSAVNIISPYVSALLNNLGGFYMELGGRYTHHSTYGDNFTYSINPSYRLQDWGRIFMNYSTGFKAPTLSQLYGQFGANPDLKPEKSKSFEEGIQLFFLNKKLDVRVTTFWRRVEDVIIFSGSGYRNADQQTDHGIEVEPGARITDRFTLRGYYAYVTGKVTTRVGDRDSSYNNLIRRPKHSFGLTASYQITPRLFASLNFKTFSKRSDLFFDPVTFAQRQVTLDAYQLLDLHVSYTFFDNRLTVFADARNILNQEYQEVYGYNTMKFNADAGVTFRF